MTCALERVACGTASEVSVSCESVEATTWCCPLTGVPLGSASIP